MDIREIIRTRKSVRTFDGRAIEAETIEKLKEYVKTIENPYGIPVDFVFLDAQENGLSSPVIRGEKMYVAGKVKRTEHCEEAFGYSFEKMVLCAWSLGIGTTWIGGTMDRPIFEKAAGLKDDEIMPIVSPLGYPSDERSDVDIKLRDSVHGDDRIEVAEMFFEGDFNRPLDAIDEGTKDIVEAVRWYPSAANMQPCRIVKAGNAYHFYEKHTMNGASNASWDVQRIDIGIAICHLMSVAGGRLEISDPKIGVPDGTEYIASVIME